MELEEITIQLFEERKRIQWSRSTGFNQMCFGCPFFLGECQGSKNARWDSCVKRKAHEEKYGKE